MRNFEGRCVSPRAVKYAIISSRRSHRLPIFLSYVFRVKNQFKENSKASKITKDATKENKNDVAHGSVNHDAINFSPLLQGGQIGIPQGESSLKIWLKSALGLPSTNEIRPWGLSLSRDNMTWLHSTSTEHGKITKLHIMKLWNFCVS